MKGYKCFNKDMTNLYGDKFEVGKKYSIIGKLKVGTNGNGFHICRNFEDTLKYFGAFNTEIVICEVSGSGSILSSWDDYYGYEKYAVSELEIIRVVPREEIIEMALNFNEERVLRFIQLFKLTEDEINKFSKVFANYIRILKAIEYYQKGNKKVYKLDYAFSFNKTRRRKK